MVRNKQTNNPNARCACGPIQNSRCSKRKHSAVSYSQANAQRQNSRSSLHKHYHTHTQNTPIDYRVSVRQCAEIKRLSKNRINQSTHFESACYPHRIGIRDQIDAIDEHTKGGRDACWIQVSEEQRIRISRAGRRFVLMRLKFENKSYKLSWLALFG